MASYLWQNRHGTFYFRVRVPAEYRQYFNDKQELRYPLLTGDRRAAKRLAHAMIARFDFAVGFVDEMRKKRKPTNYKELDLEYFVTTETKPTGEVVQTKKLITTEHETEVLGQEGIAAVWAMANAGSSVESLAAAVAPSSKPGVVAGIVVSKALETFIRMSSWSNPKTEIQYRATIALLMGLVGDKPLAAVSREDVREFQMLIKRLPPNLNGQNSVYKGKSLAEIAKSNEDKKISATTVKHHLTRLKAFFSWAERNFDGISSNPFKVLAIKSPKSKKLREEFSPSEIETIFSSYLYKGKWPTGKRGKEPSKFWVPLLLAFTGCRLNEACQLYLDDISMDGGVAIIHFNDSRPDQRLKTGESRKVPVHRTLQRMGLMEFVKAQRVAGHTRLFPELNFSNEGDGYAQRLGEFLRAHFKSLGINKPPHCFRHGVSTRLTQAGIDLPKVQVILGHTGQQSVTESTYGGRKFSLAQLRTVINKLDYKLGVLDEIIYRSFIERTQG